MFSIKLSPWIIAGVAGVATVTGVSLASLQSQNPAPSPSPAPAASGVISPAPPSSSVPVAVSSAPAPVTSTPAAKPQTPAPAPTQPPTPATSAADASPLVVTPPTQNCEINMAKVNDPNPPLNVRRSPEVKEGNIVGQLENGTFVSVVKENQGWFEIEAPVPGWIAANRTEHSCGNVKQPVTFFPGGNSALIQGEIIGGGSHNYVLRLSEGQTLTVENAAGVFPAIIDPTGKLMVGDPYTEGNRKEWSGKVPQTGEYTFQLDSNYKGFEYEFLVKVE